MSQDKPKRMRYSVEKFNEPHTNEWKRGKILSKDDLDKLRPEISYYTLTAANRKPVVFFTDDHCFGLFLLNYEWVPCTIRIPWYVDNINTIKTAAELRDTLMKLDRCTRFLYSVEELVDYLNNNP